MGLTKEQKRDYQKEYMRNRRSNKIGLTNEGSNKPGLTRNCPESVTLSDGRIWHPDPRYYKHILTQEKESDYPAIVQALTDPIKRKKLESITRELKSRRVADCMRYGIAGPTFDIVGDLLDCVK